MRPGRRLPQGAASPGALDPESLDHETVFQVTLSEVPGGTAIALQQERLVGPAERQALLTHWTEVLDGLPGALEGPTSPDELF